MTKSRDLLKEWEHRMPQGFARLLRDAWWFFGGCGYLDPWCPEQRMCSLLGPLRWQLEVNWLKQLPNWGRRPTQEEVESAQRRLTEGFVRVLLRLEQNKSTEQP
jgi:hypothetical protein